MKHVSVKGWLSYSDTNGYRECVPDDYHFDALIKEIIENDYVICGDTHQCSDYIGIPVFTDGYLLLSMRKWDEIMAQAWKMTHPDDEKIPNFYLASLCDVEERLPWKSL